MKITNMNTIDEIADAVYQNAKEKGFHDNLPTEDIFMPAACANLHGEVSELFEAHRNHTLHGPCDKNEKMMALGLPGLSCAEEELADIIIRALDNARRLGVNIQRAIWIKHEFNKSRPFLHGKKN